jgi:alpha-galactosidase/6-phospho-beta-glucosidase family protein
VKMTLLGAGVRTPFVLHGLLDREHALGVSKVVLHDVDEERLGIMTALGAYLCREWGAGFAVRGETDPSEALAGSRFVFSAIRVGQERARTLDEEIPLRHGVLGQETTGPGGMAMALRTIPVVLEYARLIERVAPEALVVNFTNPVGVIVQALSDHSSVRVVGVCDGPIEMKRAVAEFLGVPGDEVQVDYAGLNHCGWIHRVRIDGVDRLPEILDRYEEFGSTDDSWRLFDPGLVRALGMLPMEYLYSITTREWRSSTSFDRAGPAAVRSPSSTSVCGPSCARALRRATWPVRTMHGRARWMRVTAAISRGSGGKRFSRSRRSSPRIAARCSKVTATRASQSRS